MRHAIAVFMFFCAMNLFAAQRTFVSAASGSDANPCTRALPCRSFAAALAFTDADGEVIVIDSGGYGPVSISQAVSLISPNGIHAAVTAPFGNAVTVSAGNAAHVVLRNLVLSGVAADHGIAVTSVAALYVERCAIGGFGIQGISFIPAASTARLYVTDTTVRGPGDGIYVAGGSRATLDSVHVSGTYLGVDVDIVEQVFIRNSVADGGNTGFFVHSLSKATMENCLSSGNERGFWALDQGVITMTGCTATSCTSGVEADGSGSIISVSDSTIAKNTNGVVTMTGGIVISRGNNTLQGNTTDGTFNGIFSAQ